MNRQRLINWVEELDEEQLRYALLHCVEHLIDSEDVCFPDDYKSPYWESTGEHLEE